MRSEITAFLNEPDTPPGFLLHLAGITYPDPKYRIQRFHGASYHVFEYIVSGHGTLEYDDMVYTPEGGDVYVLPAGIPHHYYSDSRNPWEKIWFNISGPLIECLMTQYQIQSSVIFRQCNLENEFRSALNIVFENKKDAALQLALAMHDIMAKLYRNLYKQQQTRSYSTEAIKLKEYLNLNWKQKFSQRKLGELINKSPAQMQRIFKSTWGVTPGQYVQEIRLNRAVQYLTNTNYTVRNIAGLLGFTDEYYFSNWFKQHTGYAPKQYASLQPHLRTFP